MHYIYHFACSSYLGYRYSRSVLLQMLGTQSVWTIDLALLLRRATGIDNGLRFLLCTTTLGAEDSYAEEAFYKQEFEVDAARINGLFRSATSLRINYIKISLLSEDLARLMSTGSVVIIMLLDLRIIRQASAGPSFLGNSFNSGGYLGHYIVICGYDSSTARYTYMDPAQSSSKYSVRSNHTPSTWN